MRDSEEVWSFAASLSAGLLRRLGCPAGQFTIVSFVREGVALPRYNSIRIFIHLFS